MIVFKKVHVTVFARSKPLLQPKHLFGKNWVMRFNDAAVTKA